MYNIAIFIVRQANFKGWKSDGFRVQHTCACIFNCTFWYAMHLAVHYCRIFYNSHLKIPPETIPACQVTALMPFHTITAFRTTCATGYWTKEKVTHRCEKACLSTLIPQKIQPGDCYLSQPILRLFSIPQKLGSGNSQSIFMILFKMKLFMVGGFVFSVDIRTFISLFLIKEVYMSPKSQDDWSIIQ